MFVLLFLFFCVFISFKCVRVCPCLLFCLALRLPKNFTCSDRIMFKYVQLVGCQTKGLETSASKDGKVAID